MHIHIGDKNPLHVDYVTSITVYNTILGQIFHNLNCKFAIHKSNYYICKVKLGVSQINFKPNYPMDLVNRLKFFMESNDIAISQFADTCHIPRPTMSQILNGRNKKVSDELISKIHAAFPELSVLWLMFGEGDMIANSNMRFSRGQNTVTTAVENQLRTDKQPITTNPPTYDTSTDSSSENYRNNAQRIPSLQENTISQDDNISPEYTLHNSAPLDVSPSEQAVIDFEHITPEPIPMGEKTSSQASLAYHTNQPTYFQKNGSHNKPSSGDSRSTECEPPVSPIINHNTTPDTPIPSETDVKSESCNISLQTSPNKRITNIVVFYSDNSFQSFNPAALS